MAYAEHWTLHVHCLSVWYEGQTKLCTAGKCITWRSIAPESRYSEWLQLHLPASLHCYLLSS